MQKAKPAHAVCANTIPEGSKISGCPARALTACAGWARLLNQAPGSSQLIS